MSAARCPLCVVVGLVLVAIVIAALLLLPHPKCTERAPFYLQGTALDCNSHPPSLGG